MLVLPERDFRLLNHVILNMNLQQRLRVSTIARISFPRQALEYLVVQQTSREIYQQRSVEPLQRG